MDKTGIIRNFGEIRIKDIKIVGGKNASLGEMYNTLTSKGINIPNGFVVTSKGYWDFLRFNSLEQKLHKILSKLDLKSFKNLSDIGFKARKLIMDATFPEDLKKEIIKASDHLAQSSKGLNSLAVRSSATAEDLPKASFAGQQETFLNVKSEKDLIIACQRCYASLFTNRAIKYRVDNGFEHMKVALSIGVQTMIRSDLASSGVIFTIDPDSGFENVILISGAWGLGENIVQGRVNADEFLVYKPFVGSGKQAIISHKLGSKTKTMVFSAKKEILRSEDAIKNSNTPVKKRTQFVLNDKEINILSDWACLIQDHYQCQMDIEWAKDGITNKLYILQARPETVHQNKRKNLFTQYLLKEKGVELCSGVGLGNRITSGKARILHSPLEISKLKEGEILVTKQTDPDWDPVLKKAAAIITDQGGRTSHAAIVAREVGAIAIVGTTDATKKIKNGQLITVSAAEEESGIVYSGKLKWEERSTDISSIKMPETKPMLILAHPDQAFKYSFLPNEGVGLLRLEFIINSSIGIHPMALIHFDILKDKKEKRQIEQRTQAYSTKKDFFIKSLAEATAVIAAAFYPKTVIVRMSDFKSNEYANLLGGKQFEPLEENPMIGIRGASRYYDPIYKEGFEIECQAMKYVREEMGFTNIKLMIPFCRTVEEAMKVSSIMKENGLQRGKNSLELYMMVEIPSNALLAEEFAKHFDGFSIGTNDLTQLTLGADRDSMFLSEVFSPFDLAVMRLIKMTIDKAKLAGIKTGLCGQAPSDYPEYANFLVECGIDSISFNPDALITGIQNIVKAEQQLVIKAY